METDGTHRSCRAQTRRFPSTLRLCTSSCTFVLPLPTDRISSTAGETQCIAAEAVSYAITRASAQIPSSCFLVVETERKGLARTESLCRFSSLQTLRSGNHGTAGSFLSSSLVRYECIVLFDDGRVHT